ncbi:MAG: hypothetical protein OHK93_004433 [Ramalina farinacea]|uniref:Rhodopsin domain-containing protein n=1 Tax=Ramalina farinacea TaxID=258253 RepID=A0AA43QU27_9LECA|nr:hypothetical protein [Ramalina farinacea]
MLYYITVGTTKIAILILYLRIILNKTYRYLIYGTMTFVSLTVFSCVMAKIFQCTPINAAWDTEKKGSCINRVGLYLSNAGLDIFQNLFIYVLSIKVLYQLNMPKKQRIALIVIFVVGGFVVVTGILRLKSLKTAAVTKDPNWVCPHHNLPSLCIDD